MKPFAVCCVLASLLIAGCGDSEAVKKHKILVYRSWEAHKDHANHLEQIYKTVDSHSPFESVRKQEWKKVEEARANTREIERICQEKYGVHPSAFAKLALSPR